MTEHFITLFNYNFLPQGLALHESLLKNCSNAKLWILCLDTKVEEFLKKKKISNIEIIRLKDFENKELLSIKSKRSFIEYCWTMTPFCPLYLFNLNKNINRVTYIDADIFFYKKIDLIFNEFKKSKKSVFITEHGFHKDYNFSKVSGKFCVQFISFVKNYNSFKVLNWWKDKCIDWCYSYPDKNRLGDQKYLDSWPKKFSEAVYVSKNLNYFQAPWTRDRFNMNKKVLYHFHGLRIVNNNVYIHNNYNLNKSIIKDVYYPYCKVLKRKINYIKNNFNQITYKQSILNKILFYIKNIYINFKRKNTFYYFINLKKI
jgi:hypothetical protein